MPAVEQPEQELSPDVKLEAKIMEHPLLKQIERVGRWKIKTIDVMIFDETAKYRGLLQEAQVFAHFTSHFEGNWCWFLDQ